MKEITHKRMSPWTAMFLGLFGVAGLLIVSASSIVIYGLSVADRNLDNVWNLAENTVEDLPDFIERLPDSVQKLFNDRRSVDYASNIDVAVKFIDDDRRDYVYPTLAVTNNGSEVVSLLTIRIAALNDEDVPVGEWTEVVATPIGIEDELRGPLFPGSTRYVRLHGHWGHGLTTKDGIRGVPEISDLRIWQGEPASATRTSG